MKIRLYTKNDFSLQISVLFESFEFDERCLLLMKNLNHLVVPFEFLALIKIILSVKLHVRRLCHIMWNQGDIKPTKKFILQTNKC